MNYKKNILEMFRFYCPLGIDISEMHVETENRPQLGDVFRIPWGHQKPFGLKYVLCGNCEDYQGNRWLKAIKEATIKRYLIVQTSELWHSLNKIIE